VVCKGESIVSDTRTKHISGVLKSYCQHLSKKQTTWNNTLGTFSHTWTHELNLEYVLRYVFVNPLTPAIGAKSTGAKVSMAKVRTDNLAHTRTMIHHRRKLDRYKG